MPLDAPSNGRTTGADGVERNSQGRPFITQPDGKRRLHDRMSSFWPFEDFSGVNMIYAQRGTHVHALCDRVDRGEEL